MRGGDDGEGVDEGRRGDKWVGLCYNTGEVIGMIRAK